MAALELLHFKAILPGANPTPDILDLAQDPHSGIKEVQVQRAAFVQWRKDRCVNWPQTFLRRGLKAEDYLDAGHAGLGRYAFKRRGSQPDDAATEIFTRDFSSSEDLQGEVLTFVGESPCMPVELFAATRGAVRWFMHRKARRLAEQQWVVKQDLAKELKALFVSAKTRAAVESDFLAAWDDSRSIARVCLF
jgi:hypothetical protein